MEAFVVLAMIFCHIIDDYKLQQPTLANLKQQSWWKENVPNPMYKYDFLAALAMHAMSWSFMIHFPIALYLGLNVSDSFVVSFVVNAAIHALVDHLKANRGAINLIVDQLVHVAQIVITAIILL